MFMRRIRPLRILFVVRVLQLVGIEGQIDGGDQAVADGESDRSCRTLAGLDDQAGLAVDGRWMAQCHETRAESRHVGRDVGCAVQFLLELAGAAGTEHHVRVEYAYQRVEVTGSGGREERVDDLALLGEVRSMISPISANGTANMSCST